MQRAVFLDRDGTIIEEVGYLRSAGQLRLIPGAPGAIRLLNLAGLRVVVATNQSSIGRGFLTESDLDGIHRLLESMLGEQGARLDAIYYCPHHPEAALEPFRRACECRKPGIGLLRRAAEECGLDLAASYMVGDKYLDIETGLRAGTSTILVRTGYGAKECTQRERWPRLPDHIADDLSTAAGWILNRLQDEKIGAEPPVSGPFALRH